MAWCCSGDKPGSLNTLRPRHNGRRVPDDIFKCIFLNENAWIPIKNSPKFVPKGPINNIPSLVQIMAWRRPGDKPLSEAVMVSSMTHICVTRPQWVDEWWPTLQMRTYMHHLALMGWNDSIWASLDLIYTNHHPISIVNIYRQVSNIRHTKYQNLNVFHLGLQLSLYNILKPGVKPRMKMYVVGAALTSHAPTTSEWSTI